MIPRSIQCELCSGCPAAAVDGLRRVVMRLRTVSSIFVAATVPYIGSAVAAGAQPVLYVDHSAAGTNDGSSWCDAYLFLQDALAAAEARNNDADPTNDVNEIRVAQGVYRPDRSAANPQGTGDRETTFQLLNGVALRGGYASCGAPDPDERDITAYETILSGDLDGDDSPVFANNAENSYHVVTGSGRDNSAVLDGFTIVGGNATGPFAATDLLDEVSRQGGTSVFEDVESRGDSGEICGGFFGIPCGPGEFCKLPVGGCCCDRAGVCTVPPSSCPPDWNPVCGCDRITYTNECWADAARMSLNNPGTCPQGGGILNDRGSPTVSNCTFRGNEAAWSGGGMYTYRGNPTVTNCVFERNSAGSGGAVYNDESDPMMHRCVLRGNSARRGGAMFNWESNPIVQDCTISWNWTSARGFGAGIYNWYGGLTLVDCMFEGNVAEVGSGGGMCNRYGSVLMINCIFAGNWAVGSHPLGWGGGFLNWGGNAALSDCTFLENSARFGGGMHNFGSLTIRDCVVWGNSDDNGMDESAQIHTNAGSTIVTYSCIQGLDTLAGSGNIGDDPLFVPGPAGCYYLSQTAAGQGVDSPCVDMGSDRAERICFDKDGDEVCMSHLTTRSDEGVDADIVDMGYHYPVTEQALVLGDYDRNKRIDLSDIAAFQQCFTDEGPTDVSPCCRIFDFQPDADVDLDDAASIQQAITGPLENVKRSKR